MDAGDEGIGCDGSDRLRRNRVVRRRARVNEREASRAAEERCVLMKGCGSRPLKRQRIHGVIVLVMFQRYSVNLTVSGILILTSNLFKSYSSMILPASGWRGLGLRIEERKKGGGDDGRNLVV